MLPIVKGCIALFIDSDKSIDVRVKDKCTFFSENGISCSGCGAIYKDWFIDHPLWDAACECQLMRLDGNEDQFRDEHTQIKGIPGFEFVEPFLKNLTIREKV